MNIKKMSKEELETLSYNDIAYLILKEEKEQSTLDLFKQVVETLGLPEKTIENKIGDFYTSLTTDKRFILLENGNWDLRTNHKSTNIIIEDDDEEYEEETEDEDYDDEIEEDEFDDGYNDDLEEDSTVDEYKNLVIVDEEDLGLEE